MTMRLDNFWNLLNFFTHNYLVPNLLGYYGYVPVVKTYNPKYGKTMNFPLGFDQSLFIQKPQNWGLGLRSTMAKKLDGDPKKKKTTTSGDI